MIVGDEDVLPSVIVVVERDDAQPVAALRADAGRFADIGESAVAVVVIERWRLAVEIVGMAIAAHARAAVATIEVALRRPVDVVGDDEIESAVIVVIEPRGARCPPSRVLHACLRGHIGEGAVAIVVIEDAAAVAEDEQVRKPSLS